MAQTETTTYLLLDSYQGNSALDGWRAEYLNNLQITPQGVRLTPLPSPPVPLKDSQGTFGGLENPTGVAVDAQGIIYVSDSSTHRISKIVRRAGLSTWAHFFRIGQGPWANDRFVYVPIVNRLERWPRVLGRDPQSFSEVEVICETAWNEEQARTLVLAFIQETDAGFIDEEWDDVYPEVLPSGELCTTSTTYLPCLGGLGSDPRQFTEPHGLAISPHDDLYVADTKNNRIQVFALQSLVLKKIWGRRDGAAGNRAGEFNAPWDVAADRGGNVYIADKGNHRIQKFDCRTRRFVLIDGTMLGAHVFQVLYGSAALERYVFIPARHRLELWPHALGHDPANINEVKILSENVLSTSSARTLVLKAIGVVGANDILVEWDITYPAALAVYPQPEPAFASPTRLANDISERLYVVDEDKDYVKFLDSEGRVIGQVTFVSDVSGRFKPTAVAIGADGKLLVSSSAGIHQFHVNEECCLYNRCFSRYHRCTDMVVDTDGCLLTISDELGNVTEIPPSQGFERAGTFISQPLDSAIYRCHWHKILLDSGTQIPVGTSVTVSSYTSEKEQTAEEIANLEDENWQTNQANAKKFLILSAPGQFLWVKIKFKGNGIATPVLQQMKVYFPRQTYLQYLPAVYQADPVSKDFLERFLSIFETILSSIEVKIDTISQYFDADGVPEPFLSWLASWVDMTFDPSWSVATRRQLLGRAAELYRQRGTPAGLKEMLLLALGVDVQILEHFQLRRWLFLTSPATLGNRSVLWGDCVESRLQLEENSRIGDFALVGTGDPLRDPFHTYAHKFSVFVPAALCRSESSERKMRYLIDQEKPAHTQYTLNKVEPRFRVGIQSTIGLDTIVGAYPHLVLGQCSTLGYDTLLSCSHEGKGPALLQVGESMRVGISTVVG